MWHNIWFAAFECSIGFALGWFANWFWNTFTSKPKPKLKNEDVKEDLVEKIYQEITVGLYEPRMIEGRLELSPVYDVCDQCGMPLEYDNEGIDFKSFTVCSDRAGCRYRKSKPDIGGSPAMGISLEKVASLPIVE